MHASGLRRWKRAELWLAEVESDLSHTPAVFGQVRVSCSEQRLRDAGGPDLLANSSLLVLIPSCFENSNSYLKHTKERSVLKILQNVMSVWVFRKPEIKTYVPFLLVPVYI